MSTCASLDGIDVTRCNGSLLRAARWDRCYTLLDGIDVARCSVRAALCSARCDQPCALLDGILVTNIARMAIAPACMARFRLVDGARVKRRSKAAVRVAQNARRRLARGGPELQALRERGALASRGCAAPRRTGPLPDDASRATEPCCGVSLVVLDEGERWLAWERRERSGSLVGGGVLRRRSVTRIEHARRRLEPEMHGTLEHPAGTDRAELRVVRSPFLGSLGLHHNLAVLRSGGGARREEGTEPERDSAVLHRSLIGSVGPRSSQRTRRVGSVGPVEAFAAGVGRAVTKASRCTHCNSGRGELMAKGSARSPSLLLSRTPPAHPFSEERCRGDIMMNIDRVELMTTNPRCRVRVLTLLMGAWRAVRSGTSSGTQGKFASARTMKTCASVSRSTLAWPRAAATQRPLPAR